jgi:hypothetical protein
MTINALFISLGLGTIAIALLLGLLGNDRILQPVALRLRRGPRR